MTDVQQRILVIDDEENVRRFLQQILSKAGYSVVTASDGREALNKLVHSNFNLVLLDIRMPGLDGFQTLEQIRERSGIPVIMLSRIVDVITVSDTLGLGADDYVRKPFRRLELLARIEAKLRQVKNEGVL